MGPFFNRKKKSLKKSKIENIIQIEKRSVLNNYSREAIISILFGISIFEN